MHTDRTCDNVCIACNLNGHLRAVKEHIWSEAKVSSDDELKG